MEIVVENWVLDEKLSLKIAVVEVETQVWNTDESIKFEFYDNMKDKYIEFWIKSRRVWNPWGEFVPESSDNGTLGKWNVIAAIVLLLFNRIIDRNVYEILVYVEEQGVRHLRFSNKLFSSDSINCYEWLIVIHHKHVKRKELISME